MKAVSVKHGFFAFAILLLCCFDLTAQNKTCNLQIKVYEYTSDGTSEQFPVKDAKIKLVDAKTNKALKLSKEISKKSGIPTVVNVAEGEYDLTVSKRGFQKTLGSLDLDCGLADIENNVSEIEFLWKGDSKQTFKSNSEYSGAVASSENTTRENSEAANKNASKLVKPAYPNAARAERLTGRVDVQVTIDELGYVISAKAVSGHPLLQPAAVEAAKASKFSTTYLSGIPVKVTGIIVYNFVP